LHLLFINFQFITYHFNNTVYTTFRNGDRENTYYHQYNG
jgi:hypothetical protein